MYTCTCRQLPHAPENPIAVLSTTEKRAINLTWAQAFDGNSPLIRYILEVSENSEWFITKAPVSPLTMHVSQKTDAFPFKRKRSFATLLIMHHFSCLPKIASSLTSCSQYTSIASPVRFLANDQENQIVLMPNDLISLSLDKIKEVGMLSPIESKSVSHFSSTLRLTEKMTTH